MLLSLVLPERLLRKLIRPLVMKLTDIDYNLNCIAGYYEEMTTFVPDYD